MSMVMFKLTGCLVVLLVTVVSSVDISTIFTICTEDVDRDECLKGAIQDAFLKVADGQKELNIPPLDPLKVESAVIPAAPGTVHVEQKYKDIKVFNLCRGSQIQDIKSTINSVGADIHMKIFSPEYRVEANYEFNGRVLLLPIMGSGPCVFKLEDVEAYIQMSGNTVERDGKMYGKIEKITVDFIPKKVEFRFENLFNGDKTLGDAMNKLLNENWETLFQDVKESYQVLVAQEIRKHANRVFDNFEFKDLYPEKR